MRKLLFLFAVLAISTSTSAQNKKRKKNKDKETPSWNVANPSGSIAYKAHNFSTNEGTWMNLDVSPDGKTIVFDLLGDIYTLPIEGGKATAIRTGIPFEIQPRFSPDGSKILFTSDAGGGDNIWMMNNDGSDAKAITKETFRLLNNAVWSPDGHYIIARKHFTSGRSMGAGELWKYHITGGTGLQITKRKNDQQDVNEPSISKDGKYLYYSEDMYPGGYFQYNKDPNKQIYAVKRYDFSSGKTVQITGGPGGAARPTVSPDGTKLAFVKRVQEKTVLYIHDLQTGEETPLSATLNKDQQEAWAIFGVYPNMSWMPNSKDLVYWKKGQLFKINIESKQEQQIPFTADVSIDIADTVHFSTSLDEKKFTAKTIRQAITSPNGKFLLFHSVGYIWKKELPNGTPVRLTKNSDLEFEPSFSPDGNKVVFVTWSDQEKGAIIEYDLLNNTSKKLTSEKGIYRTPSYSNNGKLIVYRKENGNTDQGFTFTKNPGIYTMNADGSNISFVGAKGEYPIFTKDDSRIFLQTGGTYFGNITKKLISVSLQGEAEKEHIISKYANRIVPSPNNKWVAFTNLHKVFVAPLVLDGKPINLDNKSKYVPVKEIAKDAGINIHWSNSSDTVYWTLGESYSSTKLIDTFSYLNENNEATNTIETSSINLELPVDIPTGSIALTNVRILTMEENEPIIERGTIIINENKITAVGNSTDVTVPDGAKVYNLEGKTIMPGMVDAHAHVGAFRYGLTTQQYWPFMANLAYGVTTAHDPSANTETVFTLSEMQKTGALVGPRLLSTGFILYGADGDFKAVINSLEDAKSSIRRTKAFGAKSVKSYNQPRREQRQQVLEAAKSYGINVVPEGGSTFYHNLTMIIDGHTGVEHNIPVAPVYKDVLELWSTSNTGYTPTLIVNYGGLNGEFYFYERDNVWENEKLLTFTPRRIVDARSRHRTKIPQKEYTNGHILVSNTAKTLSDAGVKVNMGAHGQLQGLGAHWETWMLAQGGMEPMEALKAATINSAHYIGAGNSIGSIKEGKLADLIVLEKNPLDAIENTNTIEMVMSNGRLFDASTMNEIGNHPKERSPFYWEVESYNQSFPWHEETESFMRGGCGCHVGHQ